MRGNQPLSSDDKSRPFAFRLDPKAEPEIYNQFVEWQAKGLNTRDIVVELVGMFMGRDLRPKQYLISHAAINELASRIDNLTENLQNMTLASAPTVANTPIRNRLAKAAPATIQKALERILEQPDFSTDDIDSD